MAVIPFGEYRPDVSDYRGAHSQRLDGVVPRGDGYGPFPSLVAYSQALPSACRGSFIARKTDGSVLIFAGTPTKLYQMSNTDFSWANVSKSTGAFNYSLVDDAQWSFVQFDQKVIATQSNNPPQVFDMASSTYFADLGGSPPQAKYATVIGPFLVLSGLLSNPNRVQWSAINDITGWTPGTDQSGQQDFPDGGAVNGIAGGETGVVFQDTMLRRMIWAPGSDEVFQFERFARDLGLKAPLSLVSAESSVFFLGPGGFYRITAAGFAEPIGKERVDRTFLADWDNSNLQLMIGAADARASRILWVYRSISGQSALFDRALVYDYKLNRWSSASLSGQYVASLAQTGQTLEGLNSIAASLDALPFSLDSYRPAGQLELAVFDSSNRLGFLLGSALEATMETPEIGDDRRVFVRGFRPDTDASSVLGSVGGRQRLADSRAWSSETAVNTVGISPARVDTRYYRMRMRIPSAETWTYAIGAEPDATSRGAR